MFKILEEKLNHSLDMNTFEVYDTGYESIIFHNNKTFVEYKPNKLFLKKTKRNMDYSEVPF